MGQIHNEIAGLYHDPDSEESHHALSVLCTRLMFLMFCEDAGLIEPGLFRDYVASVDGGHLRGALIELFGWLDTDDEARKQEYPSELLARFPYMNGGLFRERIQIPQLNEQVHYEILVSGCQEFDWSGVDPTVFGSANPHSECNRILRGSRPGATYDDACEDMHHWRHHGRLQPS